MDDVDSGRVLRMAATLESQCNACHRTLATPGYVTCHPCRERRAETKRRSNEQRRQARRAALVKPSAEQRKLREERVAEATEWLKKRERTMQPPMKSAGVIPETLAAPSANPVFQKLVDAAHLHKDLKTRYLDNRHSLRFYGTYAIIAFPDVDNKQRALQVARDLMDNTTLHFNLKDRQRRRSSDAAKTYTIFYDCTCQRVSGSAYLDPKNKSKKSKSECPGRIIISVSNDTSHPLGWLGQRVKVTVTHPKA
ncbi:hypothetical protein GGX14DRAFT_473505 [Mycena pura]|uniref:Uncharacterized protein n=1 Tax=Mycena pura TaxID=153505 RepID=A0AAD6Y8Q7_9AGAR|nr:hypothetical protein GGX14DRAFT_473505 [Mycena pura]